MAAYAAVNRPAQVKALRVEGPMLETKSRMKLKPQMHMAPMIVMPIAVVPNTSPVVHSARGRPAQARQMPSTRGLQYQGTNTSGLGGWLEAAAYRHADLQRRSWS